MKKYKIVLTGGGTAGHVIPNVAMLKDLKKQNFNTIYIGSHNGIEKNIINEANIPYYEISSGKLRRYFDMQNFTDVFRTLKGVYDSLRILSKEKPDVVFSKGGFVTVPVVIAAKLKGIKVIAHESDYTPGLANKISSPFAKTVCLTFPQSKQFVKHKNSIVTGTPIRKELSKGNKNKGYDFCKIQDKSKPVLLIMGGSLGSKVLNDIIRENITDILKYFNVVHLCGKGHIDDSLNNLEGYTQFEYVSKELPNVLSITDYIISRAGANAIFEILSLKIPHILVPLSAKVSRGDQILNAKSFEEQGFSHVIKEENFRRDTLFLGLNDIINNKSKYVKNMKNSNLQNGTNNVINIIKSSLNK